MENKVLYGIIGVLTVLNASTITYLLMENKEYTYICTSTQEVGVFYGGISSTGLTAYPYKENRTESKRCSGGKWVLLSTYQIPTQNGLMEKYNCNQIGCVKV